MEKSKIKNQKWSPPGLKPGVPRAEYSSGHILPRHEWRRLLAADVSKLHIKTPKCFKNFEFWIVILIFAFCILDFSGCATIIEGAKGIAGVSTKVLEDNRKSAITKTFNYDYFTCYTTTLDILKRTETYIYVQDIKKHMIAIYISSEDTTPAGLFFKEIDKNNTQVEVSSPSTYAKEFISEKVFSVLDKTITLEELEADVRAQKAKQQDLGDK